MEIHPRTVAASYRAQAKNHEVRALAHPVHSYGRAHARGIAEGLRLAAEDMEQRADAEFDRLIAEHGAMAERFGPPTDPTGIDCVEAHEGVEG